MIPKCPNCGSTQLISIGEDTAKTKDGTMTIYHQYKCQACRNIISIKEESI